MIFFLNHDIEVSRHRAYWIYSSQQKKKYITDMLLNKIKNKEKINKASILTKNHLVSKIMTVT